MTKELRSALSALLPDNFPAASRNPREVSGGADPAPRRRAGPDSAALALKLLREAQTRLDQMDGVPGKTDLRNILDETQRVLGGSGEWGRRADGSRPRDGKRAA